MGSKLDKEAIDEGYEEDNGIDEEDKFEIAVKFISGETETFKVHKNLLIKYFIARYKKKLGMSKCTDLFMSLRGKKLDPFKTLGDYEIVSDELIFAHVRLTGC